MLSTQAVAPQVASTPGSPPVDTGAGGADRRRAEALQRKAEKAQATAEKRGEKKARRAERVEFLHRPVPVDRSWAKWVGGGVALLAVCGFVWRVSERRDPIVVVNADRQTEQSAPTATSAPPPATSPLAGLGKPVSNLAAAVIGSYDPAGRLVAVKTTAGVVQLGAGRVEDLAGQVWAFGPTDPCSIYITSPDPKQSPLAVKKTTGETLPADASPLFDCTTPTTTSGGHE